MLMMPTKETRKCSLLLALCCLYRIEARVVVVSVLKYLENAPDAIFFFFSLPPLAYYVRIEMTANRHGGQSLLVSRCRISSRAALLLMLLLMNACLPACPAMSMWFAGMGGVMWWCAGQEEAGERERLRRGRGQEQRRVSYNRISVVVDADLIFLRR